MNLIPLFECRVFDSDISKIKKSLCNIYQNPYQVPKVVRSMVQEPIMFDSHRDPQGEFLSSCNWEVIDKGSQGAISYSHSRNLHLH